ncbi:MAG: L-threonylcarbamoyladenylate synthase [Syntrophomonas sp.]
MTMTNYEVNAVNPKYQILNPGPEEFEMAGQAIRDGKIVVVPTLTIYVLVCDAYNAKALEKLRAMRNSPANKPITVVMDKSRIAEFAEIDDRQQRIIDIFSPSPVSFYVQKKQNTPLDAAAADSDALVVYFQDSEIRTLYEYSQTILGISSSNLKGLPDATTVEEAISYFGDNVDIYFDGGPARGNKPSPHIDIRLEPVEPRREAPHFPFAKIQEILAQHGLK